MIDSVQIVLVFVIVALTILLVILGIQVFFVLKDLRKTLSRLNSVLKNAEQITDNVNAPLSAISSLVGNVQAESFLTVAKLARAFLQKNKKKEK